MQSAASADQTPASVANRTRLVLGTRGSMLARSQSEWVAAQIHRLNPSVDVELAVRTTTGDRITDRPLHAAGGKGLFIKELEQALIAGDIDFAVHSMKDMPVTMPLVDESSLVVAAVPKREDVRDVLVSREGFILAELPRGARVGTGSLRRRAMLLNQRPDLSILPLRGNIDTRIAKCLRGEFDAIVLATAGIHRAGLFNGKTMRPLPADQFIPSAGQGALALQCRRSDKVTSAILKSLNDAETEACVHLERAVVAALDGDCTSPIGAHAEVRGNTVRLSVFVAAAGGELPVLTAHAEAPRDRADDAVMRVMSSLRQAGALELLHP